MRLNTRTCPSPILHRYLLVLETHLYMSPFMTKFITCSLLVFYMSMTFTWFYHVSAVLSCSWLSQGLFTTCLWIVHYSMISKLAHHLFMTFSWLVYVFIMTWALISKSLLRVCLWLSSLELFATLSWLVLKLFITCCSLIQDLLPTCSGLVNDLFMNFYLMICSIFTIHNLLINS